MKLVVVDVKFVGLGIKEEWLCDDASLSAWVLEADLGEPSPVDGIDSGQWNVLIQQHDVCDEAGDSESKDGTVTGNSILHSLCDCSSKALRDMQDVGVEDWCQDSPDSTGECLEVYRLQRANSDLEDFG